MVQDEVAFFSIIIANYNNGELLFQAVESIVNQPFRNYEIIVVDDFSQDDSMQAIENKKKSNQDWAEKVSCFYFSENQGLSQVRNFGVKQAKGQYLLFLDGDDFYVDNALLILSEQIESYDELDVVVFSFNYIDTHGTFKSKYLGMDDLIGIHSGMRLISSLSSLKITPGACNKAFRRDYWLENNYQFIEGIYYEDVSIIPFVWCNAKFVLIVNDALYNYRMRDGSITNSFSDKHIISMDRALRELTNRFYKSQICLDKYKKELLFYVFKQYHYSWRRVKGLLIKKDILLFCMLFFQYMNDFDVPLFFLWKNREGRKISRAVVNYKLKNHYKLSGFERKIRLLMIRDKLLYLITSLVIRLYVGIRRRVFGNF